MVRTSAGPLISKPRRGVSGKGTGCHPEGTLHLLVSPVVLSFFTCHTAGQGGRLTKRRPAGTMPEQTPNSSPEAYYGNEGLSTTMFGIFKGFS